jgi:hypothetical protein
VMPPTGPTMMATFGTRPLAATGAIAPSARTMPTNSAAIPRCAFVSSDVTP